MSRALLLLLPLAMACGDKDTDDTGVAASDDTGTAATETAGARLSRYLRGSFDSQDQADEDRDYYAISMVICRAEAPDLGEDVLYVEQAEIGGSPYRQRLYVIETIDETTALSRIFELEKPGRWTGACDEDEPKSADAEDATEKEGCGVQMVWDGQSWAGGTVGTDCPTDLYDAAYATSEITITDELLVSWDRGWYEDDTYAWGAVEGGYEFKRRSELEAAP